jgi:hypothetical protein
VNFIENDIFRSKLTEIVLEKANKCPTLCRKVALHQRIVLEVSVGLKLCAVLDGGHLEDGGAKGMAASLPTQVGVMVLLTLEPATRRRKRVPVCDSSFRS